MKGQSKIQLSADEINLITNSEWILTKNLIIGKTKNLLALIQFEQQRFLQLKISKLPVEVIESKPKISKGENYQGLPYLILDYPRTFNKENIFAVRTMFWWGNFFSITLHLSGRYKNELEQKIVKAYEKLSTTGFLYCHNADQWEHHFESNNYMPLSELDKSGFKKRLNDSSFIKIANRISLQQWNEAEYILSEYYKILIEMLAD